MSNQYIYNNYQQFSPNSGNAVLDSGSAGSSDSTSPLFNNTYIQPSANTGGSLSSGLSSASGNSMPSFGQMTMSGQNYSFHTPRLRYYLSKSFDIEDDMEFCPEIPEHYSGNSPHTKKFNPYTASVFSPSHNPISPTAASATAAAPLSPRVHTPRLKKPLEIINPQTKLRVGSPLIQK